VVKLRGYTRPVIIGLAAIVFLLALVGDRSGGFDDDVNETAVVGPPTRHGLDAERQACRRQAPGQRGLVGPNVSGRA
jgi:hypothetical protein